MFEKSSFTKPFMHFACLEGCQGKLRSFLDYKLLSSYFLMLLFSFDEEDILIVLKELGIDAEKGRKMSAAIAF